MKNVVSNSLVAIALGLSIFACTNSDNGSKSVSQDSGAGGSNAGGSGAGGSSAAGSNAGGASGASATGGSAHTGGSGGDSHHGTGGATGGAGSGGMNHGGMMHGMHCGMDGGMDAAMDAAMMDCGMMDAGPYALMIESVTPLGGGLHVMWTNSRTDCEKLELWRNKDGGSYARAYTLAPSATSQHDDQLSGPGTYCYRVRCVVGSTYSESNEKCGSP